LPNAKRPALWFPQNAAHSSAFVSLRAEDAVERARRATIGARSDVFVT